MTQSTRKPLQLKLTDKQLADLMANLPREVRLTGKSLRVLLTELLREAHFYGTLRTEAGNPADTLIYEFAPNDPTDACVPSFVADVFGVIRPTRTAGGSTGAGDQA